MITYELSYWGLRDMWKLKGSVFPKAMVWACPAAMLAGILHHILHNPSNSHVLEVIGIGDVAATVFGGFNFVLGFLVVFRSQQAYSRWWEGGTLLQQLRGEWFNSFSCLLAFSNPAEEKKVEVNKFQQQLVRLFSLLYGCALRQVSQMEENQFELINLEGFEQESLNFLNTCPDGVKCEITLQWIQRLIVESERNQVLKIAPPILSRVFNELGNGIVNLTNAKKINDFPIPFPLAQIIMVMLMFHASFTPLVCAATTDKIVWAVLLTFVVVFSYWSVLYIALELEMPFGDDLNDLPMKEMAVDLNASLANMLAPLASRVPLYEYIPGETSLEALVVDLDKNIAEHAAPKTWNKQRLAAIGEGPRKLAFEVPAIPHQVHVAVDHRASPASVQDFKDTVNGAPSQPEIAAPMMPKLLLEEAQHQAAVPSYEMEIEKLEHIVLSARSTSPRQCRQVLERLFQTLNPVDSQEHQLLSPELQDAQHTSESCGLQEDLPPDSARHGTQQESVPIRAQLESS